MRLTPDKFAAALQRGLAPCYLLAGEEPLLVRECVDALRAAASRAGYSERESLSAGRDFDWGLLADACATGSLFATHRVVELHLEASPGAVGGALLKELAASDSAGVLFVLVAGRLDAGARRSAWYAQFERSGVACYAWPIRSDEFGAWLTARARAAGLRMSADALALLERQTEGNLLAAAQELTKLARLCADAEVGESEVRASVADSAHFGVFDWVDRLLAGDGIAAVRGLANLHATGAVLPALVPALASTLRQLAAVTRAGNSAEALRNAGVFVMRQAAFRKASARTRTSQVQGWLRRLSEIDVLAKSGGEAEAWREMQALALAIAGTRARVARSSLRAAYESL